MLGNRIILRRALNSADSGLPPPPPTPGLEPPAAPMGTLPPSALLTPKAAAELLSVNTLMLQRWRENGAVPLPYIQITRKTIRYRASDIAAFIADRVRANTAAGLPPRLNKGGLSD